MPSLFPNFLKYLSFSPQISYHSLSANFFKKIPLCKRVNQLCIISIYSFPCSVMDTRTRLSEFFWLLWSYGSFFHEFFLYISSLSLLFLCVNSSFMFCLRIHWRLSAILKTSKKVYEVTFFWYVKVCILWKCVQYTIHWVKTQMLEKVSSDKIDKNVVVFLSRVPTHHSLTFNLQFLYELRHRNRLSKTLCGIFHFRLLFVVIKVYNFVQ